MQNPQVFAAFPLFAVLVSAQAPEAERWLDQLTHADTNVRAAARDALVAMGASAVAPLVQRLANADDDTTIACLDVLRELAPVAGEAVAVVRERVQALKRRRGDHVAPPVVLPLLTTLAELIPHRPSSEEIGLTDLVRLGMAWEELGAGFRTALLRLRERQSVPLAIDLPELRRMVAGRAALRAEVAIERLGALGPAAKSAIPELRAVLDLPEPRMLTNGDVLPLHRKAARALLAIAPDAPEVAAARAVIAGTWATPEQPQPVLPERLRSRLAELGATLRDETDDDRRAAAVANLVALGTPAVPTFVALLDPSSPEASTTAALAGLRGLGRHGVAAVPALVEALRSLPAQHTIDVVQALAATAPWSRDVFFAPTYSCSVGRIEIEGRAIQGTIDVAFLNAMANGWRDLHFALDVSVDASVERLRKLLDDPEVRRRQRTLAVIAARGSEVGDLLEALVPMLTAAQPVELQQEWVDERVRHRKVDRSAEVQRLVAAAILAIAPSGHDACATARRRLAELDAK